MDSTAIILRLKGILAKNIRERTEAESDFLVENLGIVNDSIIDPADINPREFEDGTPNLELLRSIIDEAQKQGMSDLLVRQPKSSFDTKPRKSLDDVRIDILARRALYEQLIRNAQRNLAKRVKNQLKPDATPAEIHSLTSSTVAETLKPVTTGGGIDKYISTHSGLTPQQVLQQTRPALFEDLTASIAKELGGRFITPELLTEVAALAVVIDLTNPKELAALIAVIDKPPTPAELYQARQAALELNPSKFYLEAEPEKTTLVATSEELPLTDTDPETAKYKSLANQVAAAVNPDPRARLITDAENNLVLPHDRAIKLVLGREYELTPDNAAQIANIITSASANPGTAMGPTPGSYFRGPVNDQVNHQVDRQTIHPTIRQIGEGILKEKRAQHLPNSTAIAQSDAYKELALLHPELSRKLLQNWKQLENMGYISPVGKISSFLNPVGAITSRVNGWLGQQTAKVLLRLSEKVASQTLKLALQTVAKEGIKKGLTVALTALGLGIPGIGVIVAGATYLAPKIVGKLMQPINALFGNKNTSETVKDIGRGALGGVFLLGSLPMVIAGASFPLLISPVIVGGVLAGYLLFYIPVINMATIISTMAQLDSNTAGFSGSTSPYTGPKIEGCSPVLPSSHGTVIQGPGGQYSHTYASGPAQAIDVYLTAGTPVYSVSEGTVTDVGFRGAYGNRIIIKARAPTGKVYDIFYAHLSVIQVSVGETVTPSQQIALSGATSSVPGFANPHLHLEYVGLEYNSCPAGGKQIPMGCHVDTTPCDVSW
ncbi:hypothetical protein A2368_00110 [Candidatus Collierbacteria bacterium RIFOXYB1_FULL_49_13]|uniref:M23ase beta-sheet core domain-containing protein n=1 Tax=Candidatus Collierbacteria bacterium RIFOXYB1_FULL_49_13 TaxID=1817728 RepID=A0A1F5FIR1_9BACT|nr:MAG: hypothetical protein A2368_00110 [Candidatus Collierbacteria bacterium RIFOXYB1_FULL_49_13]